MLSGKVATANRGNPEINRPSTPLVSVEGTKVSLQKKKKQSRTTFVPAKKTCPAGNQGKIRNYNNKDWKKPWSFWATQFEGLFYLKCCIFICSLCIMHVFVTFVNVLINYCIIWPIYMQVFYNEQKTATRIRRKKSKPRNMWKQSREKYLHFQIIAPIQFSKI